jgi:CheY-like chemotaxis protein/HPt (histidine-containing phosphotransfer) domain-containing protein
MGLVRDLLDRHRAYHLHEPLMLWYAGWLGAVCFPMFYLLRFIKTEPAYDDLWIRVTAGALCSMLLLRRYWPRRLQAHYFDYSYAALVFTLPFAFVFTALKNDGGGTVGVGSTLMATFFLILMTDWRNTVAMLAIGMVSAVLAYVATTPDPSLPLDYVARLPTLLLVLVGGCLFKMALERATSEKVRNAYAAIAGSIAHEMRNPLAQVRHSLQAVQRELPAPGLVGRLSYLEGSQLDALYRHLSQGEQAIDRGLQVISMTLDEVSARPLDTGGFSYLSAAEVVQKAVDEYGYDSEEARAAVSVKVDEDFQFLGDETAYLFVLFNLIKNALYYLRLQPGTGVTLTVGRQQVSVRDNGPGIPPAVLATLFEPFRSVGKSGGTGLGLAYCQRVMKAFGGQIRCLSVPGEGTEFIMEFPPAGEEAREAHRQQVLLAARAVLAGKRLLLVEDDAAQRVTTRHKLRPMGMVIDEAPDGQRALDQLARHAYDLVLLDLNMPVRDGYHVAQKVRQGQAPANRYVRIVAHTSEPAHLARVKTQRAGMDGFVAKPSAQLPLVQALQKAIEQRSTASADGARPLSQRRVLLADDSAYNRRAVAAYLREAGASVVEVDHGEAVLQSLRAGPAFDAVLMDLNMPGLGGLDTSRAIRASHEGWSDIPIIALTAHSDAPAMQAARDAGMNGFLVKPVESVKLCEVVAELTAAAHEVQPASPIEPPTVTPAPAPAGEEGPLLNMARLESYQRLGLLDEMLADYLPEIARLVGVLHQAMATQDLPRAQEALHSLLGMSGEAGALALYQRIRGIYVPVLEEGRWPPPGDWLPTVQALAARTELALREYGASHAGAAEK